MALPSGKVARYDITIYHGITLRLFGVLVKKLDLAQGLDVCTKISPWNNFLYYRWLKEKLISKKIIFLNHILVEIPSVTIQN